jgi:hypothetical protein
VSDRVRGAASLFEKRATRLGQLDVSATYEQLDPKLSLEGPDLLAEWRPGHSEALGGSPEVQLFGDGDEIAQLPELHTSLISRQWSSGVGPPGRFEVSSERFGRQGRRDWLRAATLCALTGKGGRPFDALPDWVTRTSGSPDAGSNEPDRIEV